MQENRDIKLVAAIILYQSQTITQFFFPEKLVAIEMKKTQIFMNKQEKSKIVMYKF